jgi:hypothetical protein
LTVASRALALIRGRGVSIIECPQQLLPISTRALPPSLPSHLVAGGSDVALVALAVASRGLALIRGRSVSIVECPQQFVLPIPTCPLPHSPHLSLSLCRGGGSDVAVAAVAVAPQLCCLAVVFVVIIESSQQLALPVLTRLLPQHPPTSLSLFMLRWR